MDTSAATNSSVSGSASSARIRLTYGSKYQGSTNRAPRLKHSAAIARTSGAEVGAAITITCWSRWMLAPTSTISFA